MGGGIAIIVFGIPFLYALLFTHVLLSSSNTGDKNSNSAPPVSVRRYLFFHTAFSPSTSSFLVRYRIFPSSTLPAFSPHSVPSRAFATEHKVLFHAYTAVDLVMKLLLRCNVELLQFLHTQFMLAYAADSGGRRQQTFDTSHRSPPVGSGSIRA
jgi:hypothetical protein